MQINYTKKITDVFVFHSCTLLHWSHANRRWFQNCRVQKLKHGKNRGGSLAYGDSCISVFACWHHKELFQLPLKCFKRGPFHFVLGPAVQHDLIKSLWAARRARHPITMFDLVKYFGVRHSCIHTYLASRYRLNYAVNLPMLYQLNSF